jgi:mRNA interferase HicA
MKRENFLKHLRANGCSLLREGANHSIYINTKNGKQTTIPRHNELDELICKIICKQLEVPAK